VLCRPIETTRVTGNWLASRHQALRPPGAIMPRCTRKNFQVEVLIRGERRACPLEWLDQFSMRNFTNSADFDDTLPLADGRLEASFRLTPERFAEGPLRLANPTRQRRRPTRSS